MERANTRETNAEDYDSGEAGEARTKAKTDSDTADKHSINKDRNKHYEDSDICGP